jgi:hypothetical protein
MAASFRWSEHDRSLKRSLIVLSISFIAFASVYGPK